MSNLSLIDGDLAKISFVEKNKDENNDLSEQFTEQLKLISNNKSDYQRSIDYNNKIEKNKNKNDNYVERLDNEKHTSVYRINNYPTYADDINISNPLIYPKNYDMYFDYLQKKNINPLNTQIIKKKNYINIDSQNRNKYTTVNIKEYININDYSIEFLNNSNYFNIYINNSHKYFKENDNIILHGFKNYSIYYQKLNFFFINNSSTVIIDLKPNFNNIIPYYDIFIRIDRVMYENKLSWKNIPLNLINQQHKITLININNDLRMCFNLPINFYTDNEFDTTLISECLLVFYSLGNYPINLINSNTPISTTNLNPYLIISEVNDNYIKLYLKNVISLNNNIELDGLWINDTFRTGKNIQIGIIDGIIQGYRDTNNFLINLDNNYSNICSIKMISSEIPNVIQNVNNNKSSKKDVDFKYIENINNKFYWNNIMDEDIYSISLEPGYYSYSELKKNIEYKVSQVKRKFIFDNLFLYEYNLINIDFNIQNNITTINFYNIYMHPECLDSFSEININYFLIKIYQINHNLKKGDMIFITDSIDYYSIKSDYINNINGHEIINIINNNYYEIKINNINKIPDVGNTKGGNNIKIKYFANFRLFFNFSDTFGDLIGFKFPGSQDSITNYSSSFKDYKIINTYPYYKDIEKIVTYDNIEIPFDSSTLYKQTNFRYILLLAEKLNNNYNPNGTQFFYKILLNGPPNTYLFNTFVQTPLYFNPPLRNINSFLFKFILPDGTSVNFGNLELSFTLEIVTIDNLPENTNISTNIARI